MKNYSESIKSVHMGSNAFSELKKYLHKRKDLSSIFILCDSNTYKNCLPLLIKNAPMLKNAVVIKIKDGEKNKNLDSCGQVWESLLKKNGDRTSLLINLGGGMVSDLGGFGASTYMRGIDFINIPTTLLAMVDASVGGKTGVNFGEYKNHIGTFDQPKGVFLSALFLNTLPDRELTSGFAEMIKHALIADKKYWEEIRSVKNIELKNIEKLISRSVSIKNKIVLKDPTEKGVRKKLNFGHTIGHAIESYSLKHDPKHLLHGEAIAIGIICESYLSYKKKMLSNDELKDIHSFVLSKYKYYPIGISAEKELLELLKHDKKNKNKRINFTLLNGIGKAEIDRYCDEILILECLRYYRHIN